MDLHDGVIQSIYAVGLTLESTRLALPEGADEAMTLLDGAIAGLNDAIRDIRNFILDLRPRRFAGDVQQGLAQLVREFQANTMVPVSMSIPEQLDDLPLPLGRAIFLTDVYKRQGQRLLRRQEDGPPQRQRHVVELFGDCLLYTSRCV